MMKNKKILVLVLALSLLVVACGKKISKDEIDGGDTFKYVDQGGFYLNNKNEAVPVEEAKNKKIVEWYTEPICLSCVELGDETKPYLKDIQDDDTLIKYVPLTFLGKTGAEGEVTYSDVITGIWLSMAEHDPELVGEFYDLTSSEEWLNKLQESPNQNQTIHEAYAVTLSGKNWDKIFGDLEKFMQISKNSTEYIKTDKELASKTKDGTITTPTLYVQGAEKVVDVHDEANLKKNMEEALGK